MREDKCLWSATTSTEWLQLACKATGNSPPKGFSWTSHNLRNGAVSVANSIKVPLNDIRYSGGWSTNSNVLEAKCIDFAMAPSKAAYIFFGHLKQDKPLNARSERSPARHETTRPSSRIRSPAAATTEETAPPAPRQRAKARLTPALTYATRTA